MGAFDICWWYKGENFFLLISYLTISVYVTRMETVD